MRRPAFLSRTLLLVSLTSLLTDLSSEMLYPLLPFYLITVLGASPRALGVIEGVVEALASLTRVLSGWVSDRMGNRTRLTTVGYGMSGVGKLVIAVAGAWPVVLLGRAIDRFGKGVRTAPRDALLTEVTPPDMRGRAFGFHKMMDTLGAVLGVLAAYAVIRTGTSVRTAVVLAMIPAVVGVLVVALVPEPKSPPTPTPAADKPVRAKVGLREAWRRCPVKLRLFFGIVLLFALGSSSNQFLLLRAKDVGFDAADVVLLYLVYNISYLVMSYPAGRMSDRWGRRPLLVAGYVIYAASYGAFAMADRLPREAVWGLFAFYGLYIGLTDGVEKALVADMAPPEARATVLGLHATVTAAGLLPASVIAGWFYNGGHADAAFWFGGACALLAAVIARWVL